jgi:hypothetical protein
MFNDFNGTTTTSRVSQALTVPTGVVVSALFRAFLYAVTSGLATIFTSLQESDQAPNGTGPADMIAVTSGSNGGGL